MVKPGYKQTEIGVIPEDWEVKYLPAYGNVVSGGTPSTSVSEYWDGDIAWCTPSDITKTKGTTIAKTERYITVKGLANSAATLLPPGCVLLCTRATIGDSKINSVAMATNQGFKNIIPKDCNITFLFYLLQTKKQEMLEKAIGSTFLEISKSSLCSIPLQYPKLPEQDRIAKALSDMDELIASLEKLIEKKKAIKQGAMQDLLTGKRRLPGFSGEWAIRAISSLGKFVSGNGFPLEFQGHQVGKYPFYKVSDFNKIGNEQYLKRANNYISPVIAEKLRCNIIPKDSIVFAKIGAAIFLERKKLTTVECCIDNNTMSFQANDSISPHFLWYVFQTVPFGDLVEATALPSLSGKSIGAISKPFPPTKEEQEAIARVLLDIDHVIADTSQQLDIVRQIKNGMMQQLLTGKIRLR